VDVIALLETKLYLFIFRKERRLKVPLKKCFKVSKKYSAVIILLTLFSQIKSEKRKTGAGSTFTLTSSWRLSQSGLEPCPPPLLALG